MIRPLVVAGLSTLAVALAFAAPAAAQTWGQPIYVSPYGHVIGGTPLSEVETRSHVETGRWADGYADQAYVYVPAPVYGRGYGYSGYGGYGGYGYAAPRRGYASRYGYGSGRYGYARHGRYAYGRSACCRAGPDGGYRDEWGYSDDRPGARRNRSRDDCGCGDVYLYDR